MFKSNQLTVNQWIVVLILVAIPIVNIILLFVWAFSGNNMTMKNFSRGILKLYAIGLGLLVAIGIGLGWRFPKTNYSEVAGIGTIDLFDAPTTLTESKITFSKVVARNELGFTTISGETTNRDKNTHSYSFIVTFYDQNQDIVATAIGVMDNIGPGQTKTFETMTTDSIEHAKSYKVNIDSLLY